MGAMVPVFNQCGVLQVHGQHRLPPAEWTDVPYSVAVNLACQPDYRVEDPALLADYPFRKDGVTHLGWTSPLHYADGYGSIAQEIAATFLEMGIALTILPRDYDPSHPNFGGLPVEDWEQKAFVPHSVVERLRGPQELCFYGFNMTWPRDVWRHPFPRGIGLTMFETTRPPREWAESMNRCRRLVVPCEQNKQAFQGIGVTTPISVVPLGVDPARWPYQERRGMSGSPVRWRFLMMAGVTRRKNPVGAARAFIAAFPTADDVRLTIKTRGRITSPGFWNWDQELPQDERIEVVCEETPPSQMLTWMAYADAFVFPSHGEGFGLTPLQAMSTGLPTIVADNSGMSEYCDPRYNWPIPCQEVPVPDVRHGGYPPDWGDVGSWWDPDFDALVAAYREVYENPEAAREKGRLASKWVRERWTVRHTCEALLRVVMDDAREDGLSW